MAQAFVGPNQRRSVVVVLDVLVVQHDHIQELLEVWCLPPAVHIHFRQGDFAIPNHACEEIRITDVDPPRRTVLPLLRAEYPAIRQADFNTALFEAPYRSEKRFKSPR